MNLRPHHFLCIQKFTGHGYNAVFTAHMASVVSELSHNRETQITVTRGADDLCRMCPHNRSGICTSAEKVAQMDSAVLKLCHLAYGDCLSWEELARRAGERILETEKVHCVCNCCQWFELCRNTEGDTEEYYEQK